MTKRIINYAGWAIVISASVYFIFTSAFPYLTYQQTQFAEGGFWPRFAPWLMVHIIAGMTALVLGPFQFIPSIRKKHPKAHRLMGKIYLCCVLIAGVVSTELSVFKIISQEKAVVYGLGLFMLATVWLLSSGMAYWSARSRNFVQHREWMVRSFVVTCAFMTFRLGARILTNNLGIDFRAAGELMAWACWSIPLIVTEVILQGRKIQKGNVAIANKKQRPGAISAGPDMPAEPATT
jgi:uncharacterized membrane protein